ncbi:LytR/AlgR family response regulator transcription factor [Delftia sp. PS-11]|uniref:LytR/AlgR family response regulator transcription factor n=1 Tax=Delftia sp. PS-11 TaxID=2767222 RepID=UPI0024553BD2|nr:LytTR family DNA-binding domain-containing protein [Delftia sp. PS-11]KAJ8745220.1 response regulator transcription factor [Delftia sp. PS-11]
MAPRALIAEDEPLLAEDLRQALARAWPELQIAAMVGDGLAASRQALALQPDVLFFDIRMPGQSGLEAAAELADAWPEQQPFPILVFVTAYDQYAMAAFEAQAVDYLLKPVQPERLARSVQRLRELLERRMAAPAGDPLAQALEQLRRLAGATAPAASEPPLQMIQAGVGTQIQMVPVQEIVYFEAADKYVRVLTSAHEYLVRTPLKELLPRLDGEAFWQVHRGTVVRAQAIASAQRDEAGRLWLQLRERPEKLAVSRLYAQRFKAM